MSSPATTIVYLWLEDILGNNIITNAKLSCFGGSFKYGTNFVTQNHRSTTFDANGYAQLQVIETQTPGVYYNFSVTYPVNATTTQLNFNPVMVPNQGAVNLCSIATIKGSTA